MNFKTILIIIISVLVTVVLMNNTEEIDFWLFADTRIPKLAILGSMFGLGLIVGFLLGRPKRKVADPYVEPHATREDNSLSTRENNLSNEDREYIR
jgi:hypothetical protein